MTYVMKVLIAADQLANEMARKHLPKTYADQAGN